MNWQPIETAPTIKGETNVQDGQSEREAEQTRKSGGGNGGGIGGDLHPLIQGLLVTLPKPGETWPIQDRLNWLTMASTIFNAIYRADQAEGEIRLAMEQKK